MQGIELKKFQQKCVNKLLDVTTVGKKREVLLQAPTGSGKTIILLDYIQEYIEENKNTIFVWLTPGKGNLEEQSRSKMTKYLPNMNSKSIADVLLGGFEAGDTAFINWETITKKGNTALKEAERKNLFERIDEAYNRGYNFIVIVDEEHLNKTIKAESIIDYLKPNYIVRVSATTKKNKEAEFIQIDEIDVINEGLITRAIYINENVENNKKLNNEHEYLIDLALEKQKNIRKEYKKNNINVNPMIIIQVPNNSDDLIQQIEDILENKGYSYKNKSLAIWLNERKENIENISENNAEPVLLIMKEAVSTGWDCPRAKILVKLRSNMSENFETQIIGRIRRMPQAHHYNNLLLDNCYLYTFDEKYEETIKQELGNNAEDVKIVFLKDQFKDFTLTKQIKNSDSDGFDDRETFRIIRDYMIKKYKFTNKKADNKTILEAEGYIFGNTIENTIVQDKIIKIDTDEISNANTINVKSIVNTSKNGIDLRHSIGVISSKIGMKYDRTRVVLERMFLKRKIFTKKFIDLSLIEFYAFIINNEDKLKNDFFEAVSQESRQTTLKSESIKEVPFKIPEMDIIKYDPNMKDTNIYEKNVYKDYPNSTKKYRSERMFEKYCNDSDKIKWFYKNGEHSMDYFSIIYVDAVGKMWAFYPDYILQDCEGNTWIIETKGGENTEGESKNIDIKVENKFAVLKDYAEKNNLKWGFVRDYDKNDSLYFCNTEYTEKMNSDNWINLKEIL